MISTSTVTIIAKQPQNRSVFFSSEETPIRDDSMPPFQAWYGVKTKSRSADNNSAMGE